MRRRSVPAILAAVVTAVMGLGAAAAASPVSRAGAIRIVPPAPASTGAGAEATGLVVRPRRGVGDDRLAAAAGVSPGALRHLGDGRVRLAFGRRPSAAAGDLGVRLVDAGLVDEAGPDLVVHPATTDPYWPSQWALTGSYGGAPAEGTNVAAAWSLTTGSASVVVAVLDTGILPHPDLAGRTVAGYDFVSDPASANDGDGRDPDPTDPGDWLTGSEGCGAATSSTWHGTMTAGIVGAATDNGIGMAGVDRQARIQPLRVLGRCGGTLTDVADALTWAAGLPVAGVPTNPTPARVANLSLSGVGTCPAWFQARLDQVRAAGLVVVVAGGNSGASLDSSPAVPASCHGVVAVAASTRFGDRASYSNYGNAVTVAAPGGEAVTSASETILSTWNSGTTSPDLSGSGWTYAFAQGTSEATPHVTGTVSLVLAANPALTPDQVAVILQVTARPFPSSPRSSALTCVAPPAAGRRCGAGLLDTGAAVAAASAAVTEVPATATLRPSLVVTAGDGDTYRLSQRLAAIYDASEGCRQNPAVVACAPGAAASPTG